MGTADGSRQEQVCSLPPCSPQNQLNEDLLDTMDAFAQENNQVRLSFLSQPSVLPLQPCSLLIFVLPCVCSHPEWGWAGLGVGRRRVLGSLGGGSPTHSGQSPALESMHDVKPPGLSAGLRGQSANKQVWPLWFSYWGDCGMWPPGEALPSVEQESGQFPYDSHKGCKASARVRFWGCTPAPPART